MQEGIMKTSIIIVAIFGLLLTGCSTTTYLSLTENDKKQIEQKLNDYEHDEDLGAEITISNKNGTEINGELLSVRDTSIVICSYIGLSENELAIINHSIYDIRNSEIKKLTVEGCNYIWTGLGIGMAGGAAIGTLGGSASETGSSYKGVPTIVFGIIGSLAGTAIGSIVGYLLSTEEFVLQEIPPGNDFSFLKSLARYRDEEPEYLRAIE